MEQAGSSRIVVTRILKRKWAILLFSLVGAALGWASSLQIREIYTSTAVLLVSPYNLSILDYTPATLDLSGDAVVLDTQMQLLRSPQNLDRVIDALIDQTSKPDWPVNVPRSRDELRKFVTEKLNIRRNSAAEIIEVSFSAEDPIFAAEVANQVAEQFVQAQRQEKVADLLRIGDEIERRVAALAASAEAADLAVTDAGGIPAKDFSAQTEALSRATNGIEQTLLALGEMPNISDPDLVLTTILQAETELSAALSDLKAVNLALADADRTGQENPQARASLVREAEVRANVHRQLLQRLLEVRELANFVTDDVRLVARALPTTLSSRLSPEFVAAMGFLSFLLLGTMLATTIGSASNTDEKWS